MKHRYLGEWPPQWSLGLHMLAMFVKVASRLAQLKRNERRTGCSEIWSGSKWAPGYVRASGPLTSLWF